MKKTYPKQPPKDRIIKKTIMKIIDQLLRSEKEIKFSNDHRKILVANLMTTKRTRQVDIARLFGITVDELRGYEIEISDAIIRGFNSLVAVEKNIVKRAGKRERIINQEIERLRPRAELWSKAKSDIRNAIEIMRDDPSTYTDKYLCGMINGMLFSQSCVEGTDMPNYVDSSVVVPLDYIGKENVKVQSWDLEKIVKNKPWWLPSKLYWKLIEPFVKTVDVPSVPPYHPNCRSVMVPVGECDCDDCRVQVEE